MVKYITFFGQIRAKKQIHRDLMTSDEDYPYIHTCIFINPLRDTIQDAKRSNGSDGSKLKAT